MSISRYIERFSIGEGYSEVIYTVELKKDGELSFYAKSRDPEYIGGGGAFTGTTHNDQLAYATQSLGRDLRGTQGSPATSL